jgi:hypothetical protein
MLRQALVAAAIVAAAGLFADQVGMYDRIDTHFGPPNAVFAEHKAIVVTTDAGVVASLASKTGDINWRHVIGPAERLHSAARMDAYVALLIRSSGTTSGSDDALLLRLLQVADGVVADEVLVDALPAQHDGGAAKLAASAAADAVAVVVLNKMHTFKLNGRELSAVGSVSMEQPIIGAAFAGGVEPLLVTAAPRVSKSGKPIDGGFDTMQMHRVVGQSAFPLGAALKLEKGETCATGAASVVAVPGGLAVLLPLVQKAAGGASLAAFIVQRDGSAQSFRPALPAAIAGQTIRTLTVLPLSTVRGGSAAQLPASRMALQATLADGRRAVLSLNIEELATETFAAPRSESGEEASVDAAGQARVGSQRAGAALALVHVGAGAAAAGAALSAVPGAASSALRFVIAEVGSETGSPLLFAYGSAPAAPLARIEGLDVPAAEKAHGPIIRSFAVPFQRAGGGADDTAATADDASASAGLRTVLVHADGTTSLVQSGKLVWSRSEGGALAKQSLTLDISTRHWTDEAGAAPSSDAELTLAHRLQYQFQDIGAKVTGVPAALAAAFQKVAGSPLSWLISVISGKKPSAGGRERGSIRPLHGHSHTQKVVIQRNGGPAAGRFVDAGGNLQPSALESSVLGSVSAAGFNDGAHLWCVTLPIHPALRAAAAAAGAAASGSYDVSMHTSRPRPLQSHQSEVLLVERIRTSAGFITGLSWVNAATGVVEGSALHSSAGPLESVSRLPAVHAPSGRDLFALTFAVVSDASDSDRPSAALIAPADGDTATGARQLLARDRFALAVLEYRPREDAEVLQGYALDWSAAAFSFSDTGASAGAAAGAGASGGAAPTVRLLSVPRASLWRYEAARGGSERVLAFTAGTAVAVAIAGDAHATAAGGAAAGDGAATVAAVGSLLPASAVHHADAERYAPAQILGDDSLLIKYRNPNAAVLITGTTGAVGSPFEAARAAFRHLLRSEAGEAPASAVVPATSAAVAPAAGESASISVALLDLASGRVLSLKAHPGASGPVEALKFDNWALYTYWNARHSRPEVSVGRMYEGALDT